MIAAWTLDDRGGVASLIELLTRIKKKDLKPKHPTTIAFVVSEEVGCHGAAFIAHKEKPGIFVAVDGCPMPPDAPLALDGRPGIWSMDSAIHFDQELIKTLIECAKDAGTELQPVVYTNAFSDASRAYASGAAPRAATLGIVRDNSHGFEVARLSVFDNLVKTLERALEVL